MTLPVSSLDAKSDDGTRLSPIRIGFRLLLPVIFCVALAYGISQLMINTLGALLDGKIYSASLE